MARSAAAHGMLDAERGGVCAASTGGDRNRRQHGRNFACVCPRCLSISRIIDQDDDDLPGVRTPEGRPAETYKPDPVF